MARDPFALTVPYGASALETEHRGLLREVGYSPGRQGESSHCLERKAVCTQDVGSPSINKLPFPLMRLFRRSLYLGTQSVLNTWQIILHKGSLTATYNLKL